MFDGFQHANLSWIVRSLCYRSAHAGKDEHGDTPSYDFIPLSHDLQHHPIDGDDSVGLPLPKTSNTHDKGIIMKEKRGRSRRRKKVKERIVCVEQWQRQQFLFFLRGGGQNANDHDDGRLLTLVRRQS